MATDLVTSGPKLSLRGEAKERLGREFMQWADRVEDQRRELQKETWIKALDNYEGKEPIKQFPWPGASNAVLPITRTHANAIAARLFNAAVFHDPTFLIQEGASALPEELATLSPTKWAQWWQNISKWIERHELSFKDLMEEIILTYVIYGDAYVYLPWETQEVVDKVFDPDTDTVENVPRTLWDQPRPRVLHPKDVLREWGDGDVQSARMVGFNWNLTGPALDEFQKRGLYSKSDAEGLRELLGQKDDGAPRIVQVFEGFKEWAVTQFLKEDEFEKELKKRVGISDDSGPNALRMVRVFARADIDGDGTPEEVVFDVERSRGIVPTARYANLLHRRRPLVHFYYERRPGSPYNIGVPELLANIQKVMNVTMRDHLDNNKIQNTSIFLRRKGTGSEKEKIYPGRVIYVDDPKQDFVTQPLGHGRATTDINSITLIEKWGQFVTGITDFNLGQEKRSRTPATTTLALLEEGNKKIDRTIEVMREDMLDMWRQILLLYAQNGDPATLAAVAEAEKGEAAAFQLALAAVTDPRNHDRLLKSIDLDAEVSSNAFNRSTQRQEALLLFQQLQQYYLQVIQLANSIGAALADPVMQELFVNMFNAFRRMWTKILDTFDVKDQEELNPDVGRLVANITTVEAQPTNGQSGGEASGELSSPGEAALGAATNQGQPAGPAAPEGRPQPGLGRVPGLS